MKKIISLLFVLLMCISVFAACTPQDVVDGATLEDAAAYLTSSYRTDEGKKTPANYQMPAQVKIGDITFEVTWTADLESIEFVLENGLYTVKVPTKNDEEVTYTLTATIKDAAGNTTTKTFTRVLPVYDNAAAVTEPVEGEAYKLYLVQANVGKTLFATSEVSGGKFIKTDIDPKAGIDFYVEKVEGGYKIYTEIEGVKNYLHAYTTSTTSEDGTSKISKYIGYATESDCVYSYQAEVNAWFVTIDDYDYVVGTYGTYDTICISESTYISATNTGVSQFPLALMRKAVAEEMQPTEGPSDPTELTDIATVLAAASGLEDNVLTKDIYLVKGTIIEIKNTEYGNMTIKDEAGNELYLYGFYNEDGTVRFDKMTTQPKVGDTVTVAGYATAYKGNPQMKDARLKELIPGEGSGETTVPGEDNTDPDADLSVTAPVADVAYKFFLYQGNTKQTLYMIGSTQNNENKFVNTSATASEGLDFYVEVVEGGYKFYTQIDGAKKYLDAHTEVNGTKTSKFLGYADSTEAVWSYDASCEAWCVTIDGADYAMGTYNTFTTFSISDKSFYTDAKKRPGQYAGYLITKENAEAQKPATPDEGETTVPGDSGDEPAGSDIQVGEEYYIKGINQSGALYFSGTCTDGRIDGTNDIAGAKAVILEAGAAAGEYYIYFMNGDTKTYLAADKDYPSGSKTAAFALSTEKTDACVWLISTPDKGIVSKDFPNRGIATKDAATYANFSTYATSNFGSDEYDVSWLVEVNA